MTCAYSVHENNDVEIIEIISKKEIDTLKNLEITSWVSINEDGLVLLCKF